jgi:signal peptidase II
MHGFGTPKFKTFVPAVLLAFATDQLSKLWIVTHLPAAAHVDVVEGFFAITHVRNPGAAFGLLQNLPEGVRLPFFLIVSGLAFALVASFYRSLPPWDRFSALALGLILGGAAGNLVDRIARGEVIDFLHFRLWGDFVWPDFNLADSWIVVGVGLLLLELLATEAEARPDPEGSPK